MSHVRILIHAVWGVKYHRPLLKKDKKEILFAHIQENAQQKGLFILEIGGGDDHVHCLLGLNADMSLSKAIQLIKGESAFWANQQKLFSEKFEWAVEYFGVSVSPSKVKEVRSYIKRQEEHHLKQTFEEKYQEFLKAAGLDMQG